MQAGAANNANDMVRAGTADYVLVVGVEKLSDFTDNGVGIIHTIGPKVQRSARKYTGAVPVLRALLDRYAAIRARTRTFFDVLDASLYYTRPIALRNPVVFYEGHLPGFAVNTLINLQRLTGVALKKPLIAA